ncbi:MAG TPA: dTDP-4-dehydrorhamnose reductase [Mycobacteriales bacterium]|nr:dTDP-4-dehydrorhamnose reductase [Mycobacteriales bacterium]
MPRWLVTGARGALGHELCALLTMDGAEVVGAARTDLDITDEPAVNAVLADVAPQIVVNAAAYTRVDDAETDEAAAARLNGEAPGALARWCAAHDARLIHVSTDYVFAGEAVAPYDVDDAVAPKSAYGRTKLAGERAVLAAGADAHVVRTAWLYGAVGTNFVRTIGARLRAGSAVDVVDDQRGAPTWTRELAHGLIALGTADVAPGTWHCTAAGEASWYDVAVAIAEELGVAPSLVRPTTSASLARPAPRPAYSVLSSAKWIDAGLPAMPDWRRSLALALQDPAVAASID